MIVSLRSTWVCLLAAALFAGCSSIPYDNTGESVAVFQFGEFKMLLNTKAPKATKAAQLALQQLDLYQTEFVSNRFDGRLSARTRDDQKVKVLIQEVNSAQTLVQIRWGEAGAMAPSKQLFDTIEANLAKVQ